MSNHSEEIMVDSEPKALLALELTERGIHRVVIYADDGDVDEQAAAHALLARVAPQVTLLNAALKAR